MMPPIVDAPAFTLRRPATRVFTVEDYVASGRMKQVEADVIRKAVRDRKNILVCGPTGSGKTTLTNAIYQVIAEETPDHRLVVIEDTRELQVNVRDCLMLKTAPGISMEMLLKSVLRCRPDRVGVGEVRSAELYDLLKLWNTGHPGGLCTLHCENTSEVAARLLQMCLEHPSAKNLEPARLLQWLASAIGLVVFIAKTEHRNPPQVVSEVVEVQGFDPETETFLFKPAVPLNGDTHVQLVA
jgi:type IV secretion system protein VirB11